MINPSTFLESIKNQGVSFFAGVPDSLLKNFCAAITHNSNKKSHIITANEGAAIGLGIGHYLGTKKIPLIYMQNSGLGNTINPLLSLASQEVYGIPMLIMIGWRGEPGVSDEPQHIHQGKVMLDSLESMQLPYLILSGDENIAKKQISEALTIAKTRNSPVSIIVKKNTFDIFQSSKKISSYELSREDAIISVTKELDANSAIVCTTGMPSRELFEFREANGEKHNMDFLTVGGMGHANQIALGLSIAQPYRKVYCFDGDGAALMHLGSFAINGQSNSKNFIHILFNNGVHDSVGGQPTVGFDISFCDIAMACGYKSIETISNKDEIKNAVKHATNTEGPNFIEIRIKPGNRKDIGRPTTSPYENKIAFMNHLEY